jgi:2,4-dienoyl-CoA reductase-like NADH-dependent reductase (Old Yellow Enzyme family)
MSEPPSSHPGLRPGRIGGLELRNRVIKTAAYEGMSPDGHPAAALREHHVALARGGVGMTTVAYAAVSAEGRTFDQQLLLADDRVAALRELTEAVHAEGAAASIQLGHCGFFSKIRHPDGRPPAGPSRTFNKYGVLKGIPFARSMDVDEIARTTADFAAAAGRAEAAGFDAVEIHLGHGYLLSQFLSPALNRRRDGYGGDLERRLRFPLEVVRAVREALGDRLALLVKTNLSDGFAAGLQIEESVAIHRALEAEGVDAAVMSGGVTSKTPFFLMRGDTPVGPMVEVEPYWPQKMALRLFAPIVLTEWPFEELFFRDLALQVRAAVTMPLVLLGGVASAANIRTAMDDGFEFVALGRALIAEPDFVQRMAAGEDIVSICDHCNLCVAEMDRGGVNCIPPQER